MGITLVLTFIFVFFMAVACVLAVVLGVITWRLLRHADKGARRRAVAATTMLPPLSVVCGLLGFIVYAYWCEQVRGVDPGLGDGFHVPLGSGYELWMIDTSEQAFVRGPDGGDSGFELKRLGFDDRTVYYEVTPGRFHLVRKDSGVASSDLTFDALASRLDVIGAPPPVLAAPEDVYMRLRWSWLDLAAWPMIFGAPGLMTVFVARYVWRIRKRAVIPATPSASADAPGAR